MATIAFMHVLIPLLFTGFCQGWGTFLSGVTVYNNHPDDTSVFVYLEVQLSIIILGLYGIRLYKEDGFYIIVSCQRSNLQCILLQCTNFTD